MKYEEAEILLQTYTFEEILELNGMTEEDVICFLIEEEFIELPEIQPL